MKEFQGVDFYRVDELLSDSERKIRDKIRDWVSKRVEPVIGQHFEAATFPMDFIPEMAALGVFDFHLPEEYGGSGMKNISYGLVMQELELAQIERHQMRKTRH